MKWTLFLLAVLFDIAAAMSRGTYYMWPPPDPRPSMSADPWILAGASAVLSLFSFAYFARVGGLRRLFGLLPACSFAFAVLAVWDYPRQYDRFIHEQSAKIKALHEQMAREREQQEKP